MLSRIVRLLTLTTSVILVSFLNACGGKAVTDEISAIFEELKSKPFGKISYHHDHFFSDEPPSDALIWQVTLPPSD